MPAHVIYARKSTESEDKQVLSIDSQIHELRTLAARQGLAVDRVFTEMRSAKIPGRPIFGEVMREVSRGAISGIVCWKMDRLARNPLDSGAVLQALLDGQLKEIVTPERTYGPTSTDQLIGNFELGLATKYSLDLAQNVRRGNRAKLAQGWLTHTPPLGYLMDPTTKTIVKDPERFPLVRQMWELVLSGTLLPASVLRRANDEWGFRTRRFKRIGGNRLSRSIFYRMLSDPFYMGLIVLKTTGERFPGAHEKMVTPAEFERVQEILGRPGRARPAKHDFTYAGLLHCFTCGGLLTGEQHVKKSGRRYVYYRCFQNRSGGTCREPATPEPVIDAQIVADLERLTIPERILAWLLARTEKTVAREADDRAAVVANLRTTLETTAREERTLLDLRLRELVSDAEFTERKREIAERRASLEARLAAPSRSAEEAATLTRATFLFATRAAQCYRTGSAVQRRQILEAVASNPTVGGRKVRFLARKPFSILSAAAASSTWCGRKESNPRPCGPKPHALSS